VIGLSLQGISQGQLERIQARLERAESKLEQEDFDGLLRHDLTGAILQAGLAAYFSVNHVQDWIAGRATDVVVWNQPSFGIFKTHLAPEYYFGIPRKVRFPGVEMDIQQYQTSAEPASGDQETGIAFQRAIGPRLSALEHIIPEELFGTEEEPLEGVSAVKALGVASAQGQRIFTITEENLDDALGEISASSGVINDIRSSVRAGKEVTVHEGEIAYAGWQGTGYIVIDPEDGTGAYLISGGANGGFGKLPRRQSAMFFAGIIEWFMDSRGYSAVTGVVGSLISTAIDVVNIVKKCEYHLDGLLNVLVSYFAILAITLWIGAFLVTFWWVLAFLVASTYFMGEVRSRLIARWC